MPSDNPVAKRNALVIPGGLVLCYCVLAILYAELVRSDDTLCHDGGQVLIRNVCYNVWKLMLPLILIASGVLLGGALGFRTRRTGPTAGLYHGSGSHFTLALLASFVAVPLLGLVAQILRERSLGTVFVIHAYGIAFQHTFLLAVAILIGAAAFLPYLALYIHQDRRRRRFLDVAQLPRAETVLRVQEPPADEGDGMWAPLEEEWDGEEPWDGDEQPATPRIEIPTNADVTEIVNDEPAEAPPGVDEPTETPPQEPKPEPSGGFMAAVQAREEAAKARQQAEAEAAAQAEAEAEAEPPAAKTPGPGPDVHTEVDRMHEREHTAAPEPYHDYPGIKRPITDLPGIDRDIATLLAHAGVRSTAGLRRRTDHELARAASVPASRVRDWKATAELLCVTGIGPSFALALVESGVQGIEDLRKLTLDDLLDRLGPDRPTSITPKRLQAWQDAARGLHRVRQPTPES